MKILFFIIVLLFGYQTTMAQNLTQTVKGTVLDKITEQPLIGASILLAESNPPVGATTDENGNFSISGVYR